MTSPLPPSIAQSPTPSPTPSMAKSILIFSHGELIGDGMMKLPFITALGAAFKDAEITWACGRHPTIFKTALAPLVSGKIHTILDHTRCGDAISDIWGFKKKIPQPFYDVIINTDHHILPNLMLKNIAHGCYISSSLHWLFSDKKPPLKSVPQKNKGKSAQKPILLLDRLMDLLSAATQQKTDPIFNIDIPPTILDLARTLLPLGKNVLLAPGAGGRFKCWPLANFIQLGQQLIKDGYHVSYILGPAEIEWKQPLEQQVNGALFPLQATCEQSVYLTIALAQLTDLSVANDGGVGHILAAGNRPIISMWGPTDPYKSRPNGSQVHVIYARDFGAPLMETLGVPQIYEAALKLLR